MRKIFLILILSSYLLSVNGQKIPIDKQLHFYTGATIGSWAMLTVPEKTWYNQAIAGIIWSSSAGALKEICDAGGMGTPEFKDFGYTVVGGIISTGIITGIKVIIKKAKKNKRYN
jgi:hypothetical protein